MDACFGIREVININEKEALKESEKTAMLFGSQKCLIIVWSFLRNNVFAKFHSEIFGLVIQPLQLDSIPAEIFSSGCARCLSEIKIQQVQGTS